MALLQDTIPTVKRPAAVIRMEEAVRIYRETVETANASVVAMVKRLKKEFPSGDYPAWHFPEVIDPEAAAYAATNRIEYMAEELFSVPGAKFRIDREKVPPLDPIALWDHLVGEYGGGRAVVVAYQPIAREFVSALRLDPLEEVRVVGGRVSFKRWIVYESGFGLRSDSCRALERILKAFISIATWSDAWTGTEAVETDAIIKQIEGVRYGSLPFKERLTIGSTILIVPCLSSWEFRLAPEFAEKVQLFITEFDGFGTTKCAK